MIFDYLARKLKPSRIILAGITDGVFTSDPQLDRKAERIAEITPANFEKIKSALKGSAGIDVTGGMLHKVEILLGLAELGIPSIIINGLGEGNLKNALLGRKEGTAIHRYASHID
jgi:isopentenyl phosphate kinase